MKGAGTPPTRTYQSLSLKDKMAFLQMFRDAASDGPAAAAQFLEDIGVSVREYDVALCLRDLGWTDAYLDELWKKSDLFGL